MTPPKQCPICRRPPRKTLRLRNGAPLLRCPSCLLGWWPWDEFEPAAFYDRDYFQSSTASRGYDDYRAIEPGLRRTAAGRLRRLARVRATAESLAGASGSDCVAACGDRRQVTGRQVTRKKILTGAPGSDRSASGSAPAEFPADLPTGQPANLPTPGHSLAGASGADAAAPHAAPPAVADLGCGTGVFLDVARERGWTPWGLEVSEYAAGVARQRGLNVVCGPIDAALLPGRRFDAVTMWDVIEHVADPAAAVAAAAGALRPGGVLAISTGDVTSLAARLSGPDWHLFNLPEHLFFFSPEALRRLLAAHGARVVKVLREPYWAPVAYLLERLAKSGGRRIPDSVRRAAGNALLPANLFDVLGVYAVREGRA